MKPILFLVFSIGVLATRLTAADLKQDGLAPETAVVITASTEKEGAPKEIEWIQKNYPGSKVLRFVTRPSKEKKVYDIIFIKTTEGKRIQLYFEIGSFYHKT